MDCGSQVWVEFLSQQILFQLILDSVAPLEKCKGNIEAFGIEILAAYQPASLATRPKCRSDSYFWIHKLRNKDHFNIKVFCQAGRQIGCQDFISKNLHFIESDLLSCRFNRKFDSLFPGIPPVTFILWHLKTISICNLCFIGRCFMIFYMFCLNYNSGSYFTKKFTSNLWSTTYGHCLMTSQIYLVMKWL